MAKLKEISFILAALIVLLTSFSLLLGWNLFTAGIFWFLLVPVIPIIIPRVVSKAHSSPISSVIALLLFYGLIIFMIHDHHQSDFFQVLIWSGVINLVIVLIFSAPLGRKIIANMTQNHIAH